MATQAASAQHLSDKGFFTVTEDRGCNPLTITIDIDETTAPCECFVGSCPCNIDYDGDGVYEDPLPSPDPFTYTFSEAGIYQIEILFQGGSAQDYITIEVTENTPPDFDIYSCSAERIVIKINDTNFENYVINYGDGNTETVPRGAPNPQHAYAENAAKTVAIKGLNNNALDNCNAFSNSVTPLAAIPAATITSLEMLDVNTLVLEYNLLPDILYELQISPSGNSTYSLLKKPIDETTVRDTIRNLNMSDTYYCFRIASIDPCNNSTAAFSNEICSIDLDLVIESDVNKLTWKTSNPSAFDIVRNDMLSYTNRPAAERAFDDTNVECNIEYCYTLIGRYANGATSTSLEQCGISFSSASPDQIRNISTRVADNTIELNWEAPTNQNVTEYQIKRSNTSSGFIPVGISATDDFQDTGLAPSPQSYCYEIGSTDDCGNKMPQSIIACSILLTGEAKNDNSIELFWNEYTGWENGVAGYTVEKSYPGSGTSQLNANTNSLTDVDNNNNEQVIEYRVIAEPNQAGISVSSSNVLRIIKPVNIYYPNAFTPDGNNRNEIFRINGRFITTYQLRIYNRWGELIFVSDNMEQGWDGTMNGQILPLGTYAFVADMQDMAGRDITKTGTILLLRK